MQLKQWYEKYLEQLVPLYGKREAENITRLVFEYYLGMPRKKINTESGILIEDAIAERLSNALNRLLLHEPVQYILGEVHFYDLRLKVNSSVLIPRPETEELVHWVLEDLKKQKTDKNKKRILDVGTGSGCIAIAIKKKFPEAAVYAIDVSEKALAVAQENAENCGVEIELRQMNILHKKSWFQLPDFNLIVSNPPYIAEQEKALMEEHVLKFEPHQALFPEGTDPLIFYKMISEFATKKLKPNGSLFFELNQYHAGEIKQIMESKGLRNVELRKDMSGNWRMARGNILKNSY